MAVEEVGELYDDVWQALEESRAVAARLRLRSELMSAVQKEVDDWQGSDVQIAGRLGLSERRLILLRRGAVDDFGADELAELAQRAGLGVHVEATRVAQERRADPSRRLGRSLYGQADSGRGSA